MNPEEKFTRRDMKKCCRSGCRIKPITTKLKGFKCMKILGEGGYGTTFLMKKGNEKIALKVVDVGAGQSNKEEIEKELSILKRLSNSCAKRRVLCYKKKFHYGGSAFIITEFIDGTSLDEFNFKKQEDFYKVFGQIIDAVEYLHSREVIHFDIKPENIMVTKKGDVKIIDFGSASVKNKQGDVKITSYTPEYSLLEPGAHLILSFITGTDYDWHSTIKTIMEIMNRNKDSLPVDLLRFAKRYSFDYISKLKRVIDSHIDSQSESFISPGFKPAARTLLEKKVRAK